ncbi:hypothetical protein B0H10DRAFT_2430024 [Mycena sp. CBHHK59/15]|nr:hypothetical protein B0H10DRAFT_2430024 [Mycena sp. CBHHK59/15]
MTSPNILVVMGSSPDSYYLGCGRRHIVENMSASFTKHANSELNVSMTSWISMGKTLENWVDFNIATGDYHFNASLEKGILDHLSGANGKIAANFVSFPDDADPSHYFVKGKNEGAWSANLAMYFIEGLTELKQGIPNFDQNIMGILFGQGKTHIYLFKGAFGAILDGDAEAKDHPLNKVCQEFDEGWCIERGSTLCFYDSRYFFLKLKRPGNNAIQMRWNLPPNMGAKLAELRQVAAQPDEMLALGEENEKWAQVASQRTNGEVAAHERVIASANRALAYTFGGVYVERGFGHRYMGM